MFHVKHKGDKLKQLDTRRIGLFLLFAFGIAWAFGLWIYQTGGLVDSPILIPGTAITLALAVLALGYMTAPAIANILTRLITKEGWQDVGMRPRFREGWPAWLAAWFLPTILVVAGTAVYFLIFPGHFDPTLSGFEQMLRSAEEASGETIPFSAWTLLLIQLGAAVLLTPILNGLFTFGEEFGWRAYLQTKLMPLGFRKAMLLVGVIWGLWHAPVIAMVTTMVLVIRERPGPASWP